MTRKANFFYRSKRKAITDLQRDVIAASELDFHQGMNLDTANLIADSANTAQNLRFVTIDVFNTGAEDCK
jgi:hypothetical protein